jgi:protein-L-isoaspartate O-methyltransferase
MTFLVRICAIAIFLGSCLLFLAEPMAAKRLLPLLGGSSAVWITCLVFFQTTLLLGYLLAHCLVGLKPRAQALTYTVLLGAGLLLLGFNTRPDLHATTEHAIRSVFWLLTTLIGLPFLLLSAAGPLLQAWYARRFHAGTGSRGSQEPVPPYRLFALSNLGSLLALVLYPWLIEPRFNMREQTVAWTFGYLVFAAACGLVLWQGSNLAAPDSFGIVAPTTQSTACAPPPRIADRLLWLLLSACGSVLLCATTSYLSQNVAAIPLLWILPLVAYLLSFVLVFQGKFYPRFVVLGLLAVALLSLGYALHDILAILPIRVAVTFFCTALLIICVFCHGELYRSRPSPRYLTSFYLLVSTGGALGAVFVGIAAPVLFPANYEFVCGLAFTCVLALIVTWKLGVLWRLGWFAATVGMVALIFVQARSYRADAILQMRSFYGSLRVTETRLPGGGPDRTLINGTILHGEQFFDDELRKVPTTYYAEDSGVGLALNDCCSERPRRVGIIGLGAGTVAAYGRAGDVFRFYEINPQVEWIARNLFAYVRESAAKVEVVPGDARLSMAQEPPQNYDVIVVDAFSGDAIPVHLLTSQAVKLYQSHLRPGGILAIHISNRYLDLAPVVRQQADHAGLQSVLISSGDNADRGELTANWVLVTANKEFLARKEVAEAGRQIQDKPGLGLWTDDYNSLLPLLKPQKWSLRHPSSEPEEDRKPDED